MQAVIKPPLLFSWRPFMQYVSLVSPYKASVPNLSSSLDFPPKPLLFCQQRVWSADTRTAHEGSGLGATVLPPPRWCSPAQVLQSQTGPRPGALGSCGASSPKHGRTDNARPPRGIDRGVWSKPFKNRNLRGYAPPSTPAYGCIKKPRQTAWQGDSHQTLWLGTARAPAVHPSSAGFSVTRPQTAGGLRSRRSGRAFLRAEGSALPRNAAWQGQPVPSAHSGPGLRYLVPLTLKHQEPRGCPSCRWNGQCCFFRRAESNHARPFGHRDG